ncbi:MAG TPA: DUF4105 domain-containing protein [Bacteriovoracaceae bacterium]|nr:DUF4105 domain-containing protein [Bacteriovoracaceae bacterium]
MFLLFSLIISSSLFASPDLEKLAHSAKWQKLLHYKNSTSQADGKDFFLHPEGKFNPELELKRSVELFANPNPKDGDAGCKFPARLKWLNQALGNPWRIDLSGCQTYISFFSKLAAKRASIVFSSYYLSNPNSAFGHTFLRLSRFDDRKETEMLDYGINFSAEATATNPFSYAIKGLFGGYKGKFAAMPYYYKVREYGDFEFRDLWSYELNLTTLQVLEMVDHIWELGHTDFDYFYFLENCSYHLLSIIEVVMPEKNLTDNYSVFAIPADTIRLLKEEGLIGPGKKRESTYARLMRLSSDQPRSSLEKASDMIKHPKETPNIVLGMEPKAAAGALDVAMEAFDYYNSEKILTDDPVTMEAKSHILRARAINPIISSDAIVESSLRDSPAESHPPTRYSVAQGYVHGQGKETRFQFRAALHDLLDPQKGSLKEGQLEMGKLTLNYKEKELKNPKLVLQDLTILSLKNYPAQNFWANPFSWEMELGARQITETGCFDCPSPTLMGSIGNTLQLMDQRILIAMLINGEFNLNYRVGFGPKIVTRYLMSEKWIMGLNSYYHLNTYRLNSLAQDQQLNGEFELRHHLMQNFSLFLQLQVMERDEIWGRQGLVGLQYFH